MSSAFLKAQWGVRLSSAFFTNKMAVQVDSAEGGVRVNSAFFDKGVAGRGSQTTGRRGGVQPKAKKKSDPHQFEGGSGQQPACCNCGNFG